MDPHQGLPNGRQRGAFLVRELRVPDETSRMENRVLGNQRLDLLFHPLVERLIGGSQIGEFRFASFRRDFARRQE